MVALAHCALVCWAVQAQVLAAHVCRQALYTDWSTVCVSTWDHLSADHMNNASPNLQTKAIGYVCICGFKMPVCCLAQCTLWRLALATMLSGAESCKSQLLHVAFM